MADIIILDKGTGSIPVNWLGTFAVKFEKMIFMEDLATISTIVANALVIFSYSFKLYQKLTNSKRGH
ncbi:hypothetical protein [Parabacteroides distasonis]|uniref:hypothetical protein n=1 Tax=Parabacteroides distasonis TaxID=823 RepID=UPI00321AE673